jgi:hypothetical protein
LKPKHLFLADGAVATVLGLAFFILPGLVLAVIGVPPRDQARQLLTSFVGAALLGIGVFQVLAREQADSLAGRAFMRAMLVFDVLGIILGVIGSTSGTLNFMGWVIVLLFVIVGVPHAYWGFVRPVGGTR